MAQPSPAAAQRNAFVPSLLAAIVLFLAPLLFGAGWTLFVLLTTAILALIVAWFAVQARHWWWVPVFVAIAVVWNPVYPLPLSGPVWIAAQPVAAVVFLVGGALIRARRS
ncbi:DUF6804 family protein [Microbacterium lushaniae]|uniref:Uncharacterized protein n=1 Tax=Microbacterium lushaniae TaxID=2614639 RepID=A0A5J6L636_9MICO|nr:DUF6804 family protein [Microbacterium lushaniae]QEW04074.1 hypothetical protein F6J85_13900 [Microbacterium lushaniae]